MTSRLSVRWIARSRYDGIPLRVWLFATAHDSYSFFWRVLGLEINWMREP